MRSLRLGVRELQSAQEQTFAEPRIPVAVPLKMFARRIMPFLPRVMVIYTEREQGNIKGEQIKALE